MHLTSLKMITILCSEKNMKLVVVESPNKCDTISHYLGSGYKVVASKGHLCDLSKKGKGGFGIDPDHEFKAKYEIDSSKYKIVNELRKLSKESDEVILATDPDREGEAIAWHIAQILGLDINKTKRLEFHEITRDSIKEAIAHPRHIDMNLVASQESRRIIDRVIGFKLSNIMQKKINSRSAGRVQSATLKLICDHETEIEKFVPQEYWNLSIEINENKQNIKADFVALDGKKYEITNKQENEYILNKLEKQVKAIDVKKSIRIKESKPPFTTSTLQQEAFNAYGFSTQRTSQLAQELYEGISINGEHVGLITYIRTDSTRLSDSFVSNAQTFIASKFGDEYCGNVKKSKNNANVQDAHEAIRPTSLFRFPDQIRQFFPRQDLYKLYKLIYQRALSSLMSAKKEEVTTVLFACNGLTFKAEGFKTLFDGYSKVYHSSDENNECAFPEFIKNRIFSISKINNEQNFTKPPARYSEAKVVKLMEEKGIGRPSTYAATIATLQKRKYITSIKGIITPTEQGRKTSFVLNKYFPDLVNVDYTANMEKDLDQIQDGSKTRLEVLTDFYYPFLKEADEGSSKMYADEKIFVGRKCPLCGSELVIKKGPFGDFIGCSNYPNCKYKEIENNEVEETGEKCPKCGRPLVYRLNKKNKNRRFIACSGYPECDYIKSDDEQPKFVKKCPKCGNDMVIKKYKGRLFVGCSNYPKCTYCEPIHHHKAKK